MARSEPPATTRDVLEDALLVSMYRAANLLGISRGSVLNLVRAGELAEVRIGDRRMIVRESLDELIAKARSNQRVVTKVRATTNK